MNENQIKDYQQRVCDILIRDYFPASDGFMITPQMVRKNNNLIKHSIVVRTENSNISPTYYVDDFIETHEPEATAEEIYRAYQTHRQAGSSRAK